MGEQNGQIRRLADALNTLLAFVPQTSDDLAQWYNHAQDILEDPDLLRGAPHFLWHDLADAEFG